MVAYLAYHSYPLSNLLACLWPPHLIHEGRRAFSRLLGVDLDVPSLIQQLTPRHSMDGWQETGKVR